MKVVLQRTQAREEGDDEEESLGSHGDAEEEILMKTKRAWARSIPKLDHEVF